MSHCCPLHLALLLLLQLTCFLPRVCRACLVGILMNIKDMVLEKAALLGPLGLADMLATGPNTVNGIGGSPAMWFCTFL